jgi:hypothetical protein
VDQLTTQLQPDDLLDHSLGVAAVAGQQDTTLPDREVPVRQPPGEGGVDRRCQVLDTVVVGQHRPVLGARRPTRSFARRSRPRSSVDRASVS